MFFDIDMRLGINGLTEVLRKGGIKAQAANSDDFFMFMNRRKTQSKIMWVGEYLLQIRKDEGKITLDDILAVPKFFKKPLIGGPVMRQVQNHLGKTKIEERAKLVG